MRSPDQVLEQVLTRYRNNWRDWVSSPPVEGFSFSLGAPSAEAIARDANAVHEWLRSWRDWKGEHPTAQLRETTRSTLIGRQTVYTHLDLVNVEDLTALDSDLTAKWCTTQQRWNQISTLGVSPARLRPWLAQIVDLDTADHAILLAAVYWFTKHPRSGLTIRQVPVPGMHTKWLARHRRLVLAFLDLNSPDDTPEAGEVHEDELTQRDLDPLGLRALPPHIDIILTDPNDRARTSGLRHIRAPLPEVAAMPLRPEHVLIVENKESALLIPDRTGVVVIHSLGNNLDVLSQLTWLAGASHWYWGDLDRAGITLLSRARAHLPRLTSVLMDPATLHTHTHLAVTEENTRADDPEPNLTPGEYEALAALADTNQGYLQLEQERLCQEYVLGELANVLGTVVPLS